MEKVICITGTEHIPIKNINDKLCSHIAAIQILHSSPTLNNELECLNYDSDNIMVMLMRQLKLYSDELLPRNLIWFYNTYIKQTDGYSTTNILYYYFLPCIYNLFGPDIFLMVFHELGLNHKYISKDPEVYNKITTEYLIYSFKEAYEEMLHDAPTHTNKYCPCTFMNTYNNTKHTVTLIKSDTYYIIDDKIYTLDTYKYKKLKIYNIPHNMLLEVCDKLHGTFKIINSHYVIYPN